ncbi:hypothetical protein D3C75_519690 [compost metagenome]
MVSPGAVVGAIVAEASGLTAGEAVGAGVVVADDPPVTGVAVADAVGAGATTLPLITVTVPLDRTVPLTLTPEVLIVTVPISPAPVITVLAALPLITMLPIFVPAGITISPGALSTS